MGPSASFSCGAWSRPHASGNGTSSTSCGWTLTPRCYRRPNPPPPKPRPPGGPNQGYLNSYLEEDAIGMANKARIALPTTRRTHGSQAVEVKREPRSGIDKCLQDLGLDPGKAAQLARASSGSPNALRRINLQQRDLSRWDLPRGLQRVAAVAGLVGTWEGHHPADIEAIRRLMKLGTPDAVDDAWQDLAMLDEPMTWIQGPLRGVNSRTRGCGQRNRTLPDASLRIMSS